MYATHGQDAEPQVRHEMTVGWVLRRAILGVVLLATLMGGFAWLTYSSLTAEERNAAANASIRTAESR